MEFKISNIENGLKSLSLLITDLPLLEENIVHSS